jgi:hypothetical protein
MDGEVMEMEIEIRTNKRTFSNYSIRISVSPDIRLRLRKPDSPAIFGNPAPAPVAGE